MALRWMDNFQFWTTMPGTFPGVGGTPTISGGLLTCNAENYGRITIDSQGTWIVNIRVKANSIGGGNCDFLAFYDAGSAQASLIWKANNHLQLTRGDRSGAQLGSESTIALTVGVTYDIEIKVVFGNSGSVVVKVNGTEVINSTGIDNTNTSNSTADEIRLGPTGSQGNFTYTHCVVMDSSGSEMNDFIGPVSVNLHDTTGDGNYTTWAANTGNRYQAVDETAPNSDTDYVSAAAVGDKITFAMSNLPAGVTTVHALGVWSNAKRDDATTRGYKALLRASATDSNPNAEHAVGASYAYFFDAFADSPFTSSPWGTSEVDGLEVGAIVTT